MPVSYYDEGDVIRITGTVADDNESPADPGDISLTVQHPDGTESVYRWPTPGAGEGTIVREALGVFHVDLAVDSGGIWRYRWATTAGITGADEDYWIVHESAFV